MSDVWGKDTYTKSIQNVLDRNLFCSHCFWPYDLPVQYSCCGFRLCNHCYERIKKDNCVCPNCSNSKIDSRLDKGFLRELERLSIECPLCENIWHGPYRNLKNHLLEYHCTLKCNSCHQNFVFEEQLKFHQLYSCAIRVDQCSLCSEDIESSQLGKHHAELKHQEHVLSIVKDIWNKTKNLKTQNTKSGETQRLVSEYLPKLRSVIEQADLTKQQLPGLKSKKESEETEIKAIWNKLQECNNGIGCVHEVIMIIKKMINDIEKNIEELKKKSVTGPKLLDINDTYTWRVNLLVLINGELSTKNSETFQTSEWGYKMGISVTIESDKHSGDRFISISFMIFAGEYDQILQWPFSYPITFFLMNVSDNQKCIMERIQPDNTNSIYGKPSGDVNTPITIFKFCSVQKFLENATDFIYEDHSFLKVHIDFTSNTVVTN